MVKHCLRFFFFLSVLIFIFSAYARIRRVPTQFEVQQTLRTLVNREEELEQEIAASEAALRHTRATHQTQRGQNGRVEEAVKLGTPYGYYNALRFRHGITVTTSPLLGLLTAFDASDLLYQYPSMNEDLLLLQQRQYFEYHLLDMGDTLANRAILVLSGGVEGQLLYTKGFNDFRGDDINLNTVELNILGMVSRWANILAIFDFDNAIPSTGTRTGSRVRNSRLYLSAGILTIGNLDVVPVYFTLGQFYLPFGKYSSALLTIPLTKSLARFLERAALLGFYKHGFYAELYGFQGNKLTGENHIFKQGGVNLGYQVPHFDIGAGYVTNIGDSQGMQDNSIDPFMTAFLTGNISQSILDQFGGFGDTPGGNELIHSVPAVDMHLEWAISDFSLLLEYVTTIRRFAHQDITFNNVGASVAALQVELHYNFKISNKAFLLSFYFGQTWEALAFNLPKSSYAVVLSSSVWKNTMMGLEFRHDINYGRLIPNTSVTGHKLPVTDANVGGSRNVITLQFGAYF